MTTLSLTNNILGPETHADLCSKQQHLAINYAELPAILLCFYWQKLINIFSETLEFEGLHVPKNSSRWGWPAEAWHLTLWTAPLWLLLALDPTAAKWITYSLRPVTPKVTKTNSALVGTQRNLKLAFDHNSNCSCFLPRMALGKEPACGERKVFLHQIRKIRNSSRVLKSCDPTSEYFSHNP